jgi:hypothetical protein
VQKSTCKNRPCSLKKYWPKTMCFNIPLLGQTWLKAIYVSLGQKFEHDEHAHHFYGNFEKRVCCWVY